MQFMLLPVDEINFKNMFYLTYILKISFQREWM